MKYVRLWTDWVITIEPFTREEKGNLLDAILLYARDGTEPCFTGNERFIWPSIKADIDRQEEAYEHKCEVNRVNGARRSQSLPVAPSRSQMGHNKRKEKTEEKTEEKTKDKEKIKETSLTDDRFEQFWDAYPRKVGKGNARQAWAKIRMTDELFNAILNAVEQQKQWEQWQRDGGQYIPHPATWLNQQRWEDLGIIVPKKKSKYANVKIN